MSSKQRQYSRSQTRYDNIDEAGKAIAAGGFGCVFRPPIACSGVKCKNIQKTPFVTKVLQKEYAQDEMNEVKKILPIISKIPHNERYFLASKIFKPDSFGPLTAADLSGFDSKCTNLIERGITAKNVNKRLKSVGAIYIPDGGISVKNFIDKLDLSLPESFYEFGRFNWALIDLLKNAISPMNNDGLTHIDIKSDNILMGSDYSSDEKVMPALKIIDWGLAITSTSKISIPSDIEKRPFQFNLPPSVILMNKKMVDYIKQETCFIETKTLSSPFLLSLAKKIINKAILDGNSGHLILTLNELGKINFPFSKNISDNCFKISTIGEDYIVEYIAEAIKIYSTEVKCNNPMKTTSFEFDNVGYFHNVFSKNCDIWGLLTIYQDFLVKLTNKYGNKAVSFNACSKMYDILFKYCYSTQYAAKAIPIIELIKDMEAVSVACDVPKEPQRKVYTKPKSSKKPMSKQKSYSKKSVLVGYLTLKKRCPKGYVRIGKSNACKDKNYNKTLSLKSSSHTLKLSTSPDGPETVNHSVSMSDAHSIDITPTRRCPNGYKRKTGTRKCVKK